MNHGNEDDDHNKNNHNENPAASTTAALLSHYTPDEKLNLLNGADLWKLHPITANTTNTTTTTTTTSTPVLATTAAIEGIRLSDGPHGVRKPISDFGLNDAHPATCFPSACSTACSWSPTILETLGTALANECHAQDVQVILGPGINIKRYPAGGRNHEYFSEDPYLTGTLAKSYIRGAQSNNVAACLKHYAVNNQESHRMVVNVVIDDRTLREIYLRAFEMAICDVDDDENENEQQDHVPRLVMAAYNQVNGAFCSEHHYLLQTILRDEWNFQGVVVSDWGAVNDRAKGIEAGMDLEMPGNQGACHDEFDIVPTTSTTTTGGTRTTSTTNNNGMGGDGTANGADNNNTTLYRQQELDEVYVDTCASRVAKLVHDYQPKSYHDNSAHNRTAPASDTNDIEQPATTTNTNNGTATTTTATSRMSLTTDDIDRMFSNHHQLAHDIATECIVLLQNNDGLLPLSLDNTSSIAIVGDFGKNSPRYQGMGSAKVTTTQLSNVYDSLQQTIRSSSSSSSVSNTVLSFAPGYDVDGESDDIDQHLIDEAVTTSRDADIVLVFVGLPEIMESEGFDRPHCRLPQQHITLVESVCNVNTNVVVVLSNGGAVKIPESFVRGAKAILEGFLLGQAGGSAIVDVLLGKVSPSGKMPETIVVDTSHIPSHPYFPGTRHTVEYREGLDVGYRYFNKPMLGSGGNRPKDIVRFPFGHGLQYTTFEYRNLTINVEQDVPTKKRVVVTLDVQNVGQTHTAKEVIQVYVRTIGSAVYRPYHELKDFQKIEVQPGQTKTVTFVLNERSFAFYDIGTKSWVVEPSTSGCTYEIQIGASSRDIRLQQSVSFTTGQEASMLARESYPPMDETVEREWNNEYYVDDATFAKRFGTSELSVLDIISRTNQENVHEHFVHRNTLLKEAAAMSILGWILFHFTYQTAISQVKRGPRRKRELRMIRANVENLPLRVLVLFAKGTLSFRILDCLILLMNGYYIAALTSIFSRSRRQQVQ